MVKMVDNNEALNIGMNSDGGNSAVITGTSERLNAPFETFEVTNYFGESRILKEEMLF